MSIKLIVGLGNPGSAYEQTRHNVGAWFVKAYAESLNLEFKTDKKLQAALSPMNTPPLSIALALPLTFMNHSGSALRAISHFYRIAAEETLIVHDDLDLDLGRIKLKTGGGHGGHNGLRDIITQLGTQHFHRMRIGIGHPGHKDLVHPYVLGKPSSEDKRTIEEAITKTLDFMPLVLCGDLTKAMTQINQ